MASRLADRPGRRDRRARQVAVSPAEVDRTRLIPIAAAQGPRAGWTNVAGRCGSKPSSAMPRRTTGLTARATHRVRPTAESLPVLSRRPPSPSGHETGDRGCAWPDGGRSASPCLLHVRRASDTAVFPIDPAKRRTVRLPNPGLKTRASCRVAHGAHCAPSGWLR